jgi:hypothetical protein
MTPTDPKELANELLKSFEEEKNVLQNKFTENFTQLCRKYGVSIHNFNFVSGPDNDLFVIPYDKDYSNKIASEMLIHASKVLADNIKKNNNIDAIFPTREVLND